jgi:L-alanine-DL-glutamate epimerase-like enolase superfamily enzyme
VAALSHEMTTALPPYSNPPALAGADACLWDINAKAANLPLYKYLGAARHETRTYASTVAYPTIDGYLDALRPAVAESFTAAKFHPFGQADRDIELARAIRHEFPNLDLMIDPVCAYTLPRSLNTQMLKSAHACEAFGHNYEIHSYGPPLNLAMYLNVALTIRNCDFAEIMVPQNLLGIGMADLPTIDDTGYIAAPQKPGLGYDIDRDKIDDLTLKRC